jgi:hypothetical protein
VAGLSFDLPAEWLDTTGEVPSPSPFTFTRPTGIGAIQISLGRYKSGVRPNIDGLTLLDMFNQRARSLGWKAAGKLAPAARSTVAWGLERSEAEVIALWYVTDGFSLAQVTYVGTVAESPMASAELDVAGQLAMSLTFD